MHQTNSKAEETQSRQEDVLYFHMTRKQWGLALLAWDHGDKRGYQFEDGKLRVFKQGYFDLLEEAEAPPKGVFETLRRRLGWKAQEKPKKPNRSTESFPFEQQLVLFQDIYPKGFQGSKWAREKRGIDTTRCLQRHRDLAHVQARKDLSRAQLNKLIEEEDYTKIIRRMLKIGNGTDLISKSTLRPLEELLDRESQELGERLFELIHGDEELAIRFERFVDSLAELTGKSPAWQLATVFLALVLPKDHICVKPQTMRTQAAFLGRQQTISAMPNAPMYERLRAMTHDVYRRLEEAGYHPRDFLDVYDFMETTLSRKAIESMKVMGSASTDPDERVAA